MALLIIGEKVQDFAQATMAQKGGLDIRAWPDAGDLGDIRYALAWKPPHGVLARLPNLELVISVGAGVDHLLGDASLPQVPLVRFVDPDLTGRMCEYVVLHTLYHHRRMSELRDAQQKPAWANLSEPAARELRVGIMGLGVLGLAAATRLRPFGYQLRGWSRSPAKHEGIACYHGLDQLPGFLAATDILIVLLPLTDTTRGIINAQVIAGLAQDGKLPGPVLINAGRGGLQVEADIIAALDSGKLYAASLDVFETEPLPAASPLWRHPRAVVTPHNAAETTPRAIARYALRQIAKHRSGETLENVVDKGRGY